MAVGKRGALQFPRCGIGYYGQPVGILMYEYFMSKCHPQETIQTKGKLIPSNYHTFTRIPGDVGNASTYDFPVQFKLIRDTDFNELLPWPTDHMREKVRKACRELEEDGVRCIATTCGLMASLQQDMASAVNIPVFSSACLQIPLACQIVAPKKVAVLTATGRVLSERHLQCVGVTPEMPHVIWGMEKYENTDYSLWTDELDMDKRREYLERVMRHAALDCLEHNPDVGAFVLECTNMPPASLAIQEATGMPVFDVITMINWARLGVAQRRYYGFM